MREGPITTHEVIERMRALGMIPIPRSSAGHWDAIGQDEVDPGTVDGPNGPSHDGVRPSRTHRRPSIHPSTMRRIIHREVLATAQFPEDATVE